MKTPRLALIALLACASAANAAMPTWTVTDESFRAWPTISFNDGHGSRSLRCRLSECDPSKNKATSKLYVMKQTGALEPIRATITELHPLGRNDPRRWFGKEYDEVKRVIDSHRTRYATELSNYTLDNSGAQLVVVQGNSRFPASTDIRQQYFSATGAVIAVNPPAKMADDVLRVYGPPAPPTTPTRGDPATARWWCDPATGEKYSAVRGRRGSALLANQNAECKKAVTATPPPPVVVTPPPAETAASLALLPGDETRWLTKRQATAYSAARTAARDAAARKAADDQYRALVEAQTRPEAQAAYKAARALPVDKSSAALKAAVGGVEMWGGKDAKDVTAIVAPFQAAASSAAAKLLEIQLSKAEWDLLQKSTASLNAYTDARKGIDGDNGDRSFNKEYVDPVALRVSVAAARIAAGAPTEVSPDPDGAALVPLLTEDEKKLLTPSELAVYQSIFDTAKGDPKDPNLQREAARLRALIASENRGKDPAYAAPSSLDAFNKLPEWQKRKFCADLVKSGANLGADVPAPELGGTGDARSQLGQTARRSGRTATTTTADAPGDWTAEACRPYRTPPVTANPGTRPPVTADVPSPSGVAVGDDTEAKGKEPSKWVTADLMTSAAKGALFGLVLGSFFGPVGLILGPLIGAAVSYGLTKLAEK